jgi:hypothetical protein
MIPADLLGVKGIGSRSSRSNASLPSNRGQNTIQWQEKAETLRHSVL